MMCFETVTNRTKRESYLNQKGLTDMLEVWTFMKQLCFSQQEAFMDYEFSPCINFLLVCVTR